MNLKQLKAQLASKTFPKQIQLSKGEKIIDVDKFIKSHIITLQNNSGNPTFMPYYDRLVKLNSIL